MGWDLPLEEQYLSAIKAKELQKPLSMSAAAFLSHNRAFADGEGAENRFDGLKFKGSPILALCTGEIRSPEVKNTDSWEEIVLRGRDLLDWALANLNVPKKLKPKFETAFNAVEKKNRTTNS